MPPKKTPKRRYRRRYRRKTYTPRKALTLTGFPDRKFVKLRYCEEIALNPGLGGKVAHIFNANALYDPNSTGVGHQPMGFDQWINIYDHYTVLGAKITMTYVHSDVSTVNPAYWGVCLSDNGTTITGAADMNTVLEQKYVNAGKGRIGGFVYRSTSKSNLTKATSTFSASKFFGKKEILGESQYRGDSASNPGELAFFECWAGSVVGNDPGTHLFLITIDYVACFTEPKPLVGS